MRRLDLEQRLDAGDLVLVRQAGHSLGRPLAEEDVELEPAALARAEDDAPLPRRQVRRQRGAGLGRRKVRRQPLFRGEGTAEEGGREVLEGEALHG